MRVSGCLKINFAGGEPFLHPKFLGELVRYSKIDLKFESVSIISNASKIKQMEEWFKEFGQYLDILGVSCDSAVSETNTRIGRHAKGKTADVHVTNVLAASKVRRHVE